MHVKPHTLPVRRTRYLLAEICIATNRTLCNIYVLRLSEKSKYALELKANKKSIISRWMCLKFCIKYVIFLGTIERRWTPVVVAVRKFWTKSSN